MWTPAQRLKSQRPATLLLAAALFLPAQGQAMPAEQGRLVGTQQNSRLGESFQVVPDLNGDGNADLLLAAPNVGTLYLYFNLPGLNNQNFPESSQNLIQFQEPGPISAQSFDFNLDGIPDLMVGLPNRNGRGEVYLFAGPLNTSQPLSEADATLTLFGADGSGLGAALQPMPDSANLAARLYLGAPDANGGSGKLYEVFADALASLETGKQFDVEAVASRTITTTSLVGRLGTQLLQAPDTDLDGDPELLISAPGVAPGGEVYCLTSSSSPDLLELDGQPRIATLTEGAFLGLALSAAIDLTQTSEILVGAPGDPGLGASAPAGQVGLVSLRDVLDAANTDGSAVFLEDAAWFVQDRNSGTGLGKSLTSVKDLNGDGLPELLLGAPNAGEGAGELYFFLSAQHTWATDLATADFLFMGDGDNLEQLGAMMETLPAPDLDLLAVGAPRALNADTGTRTGALYLLDLKTFTADQDSDGQSPLEGDCDDNDPERAPRLSEACDGKDNDCNGQLSPLEQDSDKDGYAGCALGDKGADCDVDNPLIHPSAPELCDGLDNDCDAQVPASENDADHDGVRACASESTPADCDDNNNTLYPGAPELCDGEDNDCSGDIPAEELDHDGDGVPGCATSSVASDCDDLNPNRAPTLTEVCDGIDNDCDLVLLADELDSDDDGYSTCPTQLSAEFPNGDCDDQDSTRHPKALELCDGNDSDCDGQSDQDSDGDGFYACSDGSDTGLQDCNDADKLTYPGAAELCDGLDNNCDGTVPAVEQDLDHDGFAGCALGELPADCDDTSDKRAPGHPEVCDGIDNDCDQNIPAEEMDKDGDAYRGCEGEKSADCDDNNSNVFPGAQERCDGLDDNCDGGLPLVELDQDTDGFRTCDGDCDDANANVAPGHAEVCDGLDNNCDHAIPVSETTDGDADTFTVCEGDCDDADATIYPNAPELQDKKDNDCDGIVDDVTCIDDDGDGFPTSACTGSTVLDCNDQDASVYPGAPEGTPDETAGWLIGDGKDNDCDGQVDEGTDRSDEDKDGYTELKGDCDDYNPTIHPGVVEALGDGRDNDCNGLVDEDSPQVDNDGDGFANQSAGGKDVDCDDQNPDVYPGAVEDPDTAYDDNCDGVLVSDRDGDSVDDAADCLPDDPSSFPGADERPDGMDNNCNGAVDEGLSDGPGWSCAALAQSGGVAVACSTLPAAQTPSNPPRPAPLPWLLLGGSVLYFRRRRA